MEPEREIDFITSIIDKGFHYDKVNDEYVRKWITEGGEESILEIYKKQWDTNQWKQHSDAAAGSSSTISS